MSRVRQRLVPRIGRTRRRAAAGQRAAAPQAARPPGLHHRVWLSSLASYTEISKKPSEKSLATSKSAQHQADHGDVDERFAGRAQPLIILAQPAVLPLPSKRPFHYPPAWEDPETGRREVFGPIDLLRRDVAGNPHFLVARRVGHDLSRPTQRPFYPVPALLFSAVSRIQSDPSQPRRTGPDWLAQEQLHAVAVHDAGGMDRDGEQETLGVDQDVPLASLHLLAPVE